MSNQLQYIATDEERAHEWFRIEQVCFLKQFEQAWQ